MGGRTCENACDTNIQMMMMAMVMTVKMIMIIGMVMMMTMIVMIMIIVMIIDDGILIILSC